MLLLTGVSSKLQWMILGDTFEKEMHVLLLIIMQLPTFYICHSLRIFHFPFRFEILRTTVELIQNAGRYTIYNLHNVYFYVFAEEQMTSPKVFKYL